jgi:hypothetical protein
MEVEKAHESNRRTSSGHRKIELADMILMWLVKKRQAWSYVVLGVMFDVSWKSASNYCEEIQSVFVGTLLGRLFYLPYAEDIEQYIPEHFRKRFPDAKLIGDGAHFPGQTPLRFSYNGLTFCIYKWGTTWQLILSKQFVCVLFVRCCFCLNLTTSRPFLQS